MRRSMGCPTVKTTQSADTFGSEKVTDKTVIPPPDWEALIAHIADLIIAERSPARIMDVRAKLYDLLTHCIPPTTILKVDSPSSRAAKTKTWADSNSDSDVQVNI